MKTRKIYISSGHSNKPGRDRGASGNGFIEGELAVELRELIVKELKELNINAIIDKNDSVLLDTIKVFRNLTTNKCILLDIHWNAGPPTATGTETLIPGSPSNFEINLAESLSKTIANTLNIRLRGNYKGKKGVKTELESHHGSLGWMRLTGENVLIEICFISNKNDMISYQNNKIILAKNIAQILQFYSNIDNPTNIDSYYTVISGDTLFSIANKHNLTINQLKILNNLQTNIIQINQQLKIK
jgi:N-acetylmuramoyl-L-alanine amidase